MATEGIPGTPDTHSQGSTLGRRVWVGWSETDPQWPGTHPQCVLVEPPQEVEHPVPKGLQGVRGELPPDVRDVPDEERPGYVI